MTQVIGYSRVKVSNQRVTSAVGDTGHNFVTLAFWGLYILMAWRNRPLRSSSLQIWLAGFSPGPSGHELHGWRLHSCGREPGVAIGLWGPTEQPATQNRPFKSGLLRIRTTKRPQSTRVPLIWKGPDFLSGIKGSLETQVLARLARRHQEAYLLTAFWASMRFPARKVRLPMMARYLRVWNMLRWVQ